MHVLIPTDNVAFQLGEVFQILSGGVLRATPHSVRAPRVDRGPREGLFRNTLALFMQPRWDVALDVPPCTENKGAARGDLVEVSSDPEVACWQPGIGFGEFSERKFNSYYN